MAANSGGDGRHVKPDKREHKGKHRSKKESTKAWMNEHIPGKHAKAERTEEYAGKHRKPAAPAAKKSPAARKTVKAATSDANTRRRNARATASAQKKGGSALPKGVTPRSKKAA